VVRAGDRRGLIGGAGPQPLPVERYPSIRNHNKVKNEKNDIAQKLDFVVEPALPR
jgi:hypothetical protein